MFDVEEGPEKFESTSCFSYPRAHSDVRTEGKGRSVQRPLKILENFPVVVPLPFLAPTHMSIQPRVHRLHRG